MEEPKKTSVWYQHVMEVLQNLYKEHGDRFWPAPRLKRMVSAKFLGKKNGRGFFEYTA